MMADEFKACSIAGCNGNAHWKAKGVKGWCWAHYRRASRYGDPLGGTHRVDNSGQCQIDGCERKASTMGLCQAHYQRSRKYGDPTCGGTLRGEPEEFYRKVVLPFAGDECLIWPYARNEHGYGRMFAADGATTLVHRRACIEVHGEPPEPEYASAHNCGNGVGGCVNPRHVRWATAQENMDDKIRHGTNLIKARGDSHPKAKLNASAVRDIRRNRGASSTADVAAKYGVKPETIKAVYRGLTWRGIE